MALDHMKLAVECMVAAFRHFGPERPSEEDLAVFIREWLSHLPTDEDRNEVARGIKRIVTAVVAAKHHKPGRA
jgi:hypothetical protein